LDSNHKSSSHSCESVGLTLATWLGKKCPSTLGAQRLNRYNIDVVAQKINYEYADFLGTIVFYFIKCT